MEVACNGREALAKIMRGPYLAVLMDFLMPVLDGISATAMLRAWEGRQRREARRHTQAEFGEGAADDQLQPLLLGGGGIGTEGGEQEESGCSDDGGDDRGGGRPPSPASWSQSGASGSGSSQSSEGVWSIAPPEAPPETAPVASWQRQLVIGISANAEQSDLEAARAAGVDHFWAKPVVVHEVVAFLERLVTAHAPVEGATYAQEVPLPAEAIRAAGAASGPGESAPALTTSTPLVSPAALLEV